MLVDGPAGRTLLTKGAYAKILDICTTVATVYNGDIGDWNGSPTNTGGAHDGCVR